jgi:hypothetical protein
MGFFTKKRKDATLVKPKDSIGVLMPLIFPRRVDSEVSMTRDFDITKLCKYIDDINKSGKLEFKMTYFHAIMASCGVVFFNRNKLKRLIKNKRLYERNKITFAFIAKDEMSDNADEKIICLDLDPNDNGLALSRKMAIDVFKSKNEGKNDFDDTLKIFTSMPKWVLGLVVRFVKFLDKHGINPRVLTEGDTNYSTVIFSNLGSINSNSCYHHLNEYGTNSIVITIGTIKEINKRRKVDITFTIDERIADGFYFAKSINMAKEVMNNPHILDKKIGDKYKD